MTHSVECLVGRCNCAATCNLSQGLDSPLSPCTRRQPSVAAAEEATAPAGADVYEVVLCQHVVLQEVLGGARPLIIARRIYWPPTDRSLVRMCSLKLSKTGDGGGAPSRAARNAEIAADQPPGVALSGAVLE